MTAQEISRPAERTDQRKVELQTSAAKEEISNLKKRITQLRNDSKWVEAMPLTEKFVATTEALHGENSVEMADALHQWAWLVQQNGDYDKAEALWLRALAIDEKLFGKDTLQTTRRLHLLGNLYRDRGDYEKAAALLQRSLRIRQNGLGTNHIETAQVRHSLGRVQMARGNFADAEASFLGAARILEKAGADAADQFGGALSSLGWLYLDLGDFDQAEQMMRRSLEVRKKLHGLMHEQTANSLRELGMIHSAHRDYAGAESFYQQSLEVRAKLLGTNHVSLAALLEDLGVSFLARNDGVKAAPVLERAREILQKNLGAQHPRVASVLTLLSRMHEIKGEYKVALALSEQAKALREKDLGAAHFLTISSLRQSARLAIALGDRDRALSSADRIQKSDETILSDILSFTSEQQRLAFRKQSIHFNQSYDLWADAGAIKPLARSVLRTKGLMLDSLLEDRLLAKASNDRQVREIVQEIATYRQRLTQYLPLVAQNTPQTAGNLEVQSLSAKIQSLESTLARHVAGFGRARRALSVDLEQICSKIPERSVLLEMLRYRHYAGKGQREEYYGVLVLSRSAEPRWVCLGPAKAIDKSIHFYQHAVRNATAEPGTQLRELYQQLWTPLARELPADVQQIIISPDGELNFVSFATLLTPAGHFLGEDYSCGYVSCSRDLLAETAERSCSPQLCVWANPDFGSMGELDVPLSPAPQGSHNLNFRPLPGAEKEGRLLCERAAALGFEKAVLRVGSKATEAELETIHSPKALHLATHAFLLPEIEMPEHDNDMPAREYAMPMLNPMLRSGLALAGAQRTIQLWTRGKSLLSHDDGILTAAEIGDLDLQGTWLVVLSACDTGAGEARAGEGVLGVRRGFAQAGAQNLLMTLWPIDDEQTSAFMPQFYARAQKSGNPSEALALVQRGWLERLRREKGVAAACRLAGPFILSFQGTPGKIEP